MALNILMISLGWDFRFANMHTITTTIITNSLHIHFSFAADDETKYRYRRQFLMFPVLCDPSSWMNRLKEGYKVEFWARRWEWKIERRNGKAETYKKMDLERDFSSMKTSFDLELNIIQITVIPNFKTLTVILAKITEPMWFHCWSIHIKVCKISHLKRTCFLKHKVSLSWV